MKTLSKIIFAVYLLSVATVDAQWRFVKSFPDNNFKGGRGCHGLAVDPDGKVWIQLFDETDSIEVSPGVKLPTRVVYVFNSDGTPASFSPIKSATVNGVTDFFQTPPGWSNRGLRADSDGNILMVSGNRLFRLNYKTGAGMAKAPTDFYFREATAWTAPAIDGYGNIFIASVVGNYPVWILDKDFNNLGLALDTSKGFSRSFAVSDDGNTIYWAGFTNHAVYKYVRPDEFSSFAQADTILKGFDAESFTWNPKSRRLWLSAGDNINLPNRFPGTKTTWSPNTWYAYDHINDQIVDSLKWRFRLPNNPNERPRAIAFNPNGDMVYVGCFGGSDYAPIQMFAKIPPGPPVVTNAIPNQQLALGWKPLTRDLNEVFVDPESDSLVYSANSSDSAIAIAGVRGSMLTVTPVAVGSTGISIAADDRKSGVAVAAFMLTVRTNEPPQAINHIPAQKLTVDRTTFARNIGASPALFYDSDHDTLRFKGKSSNNAVAFTEITVSVLGSVLGVLPVNSGKALITLVADDGYGGTDSLTFDTTVNSPPLVINSIMSINLAIGSGDFVRDLNTSPFVFSDPDGDELRYSASSSDSAVATANISGSLFSVVPVGVGDAIVTVEADDNKGGETKLAFNVSVKDPNLAPLINPVLLASPQPLGQAITISVEITDNTGVADARLFFRQGGETNFTVVNLRGSTSLRQGTIPKKEVTPFGLEYYFEATDVDGLRARQPSAGVYSIRVDIPDPGITNTNAQPTGSEQTAYRLVSVPLDLKEKSARSVLEDDLGPYKNSEWRFYERRADDQSYNEYPATSIEITPGKGYWLIVKEPGKRISTGGGVTVRTDTVFVISVHPGWNFVGNSFDFAIPVQNLRLKSTDKRPTLRAYKGIWNTDPIEEMQPFEGYAVANDSSFQDTLLINPEITNTTSALVVAQTSSLQTKQTGSLRYEWSIRIRAQCQEARDGDNLATLAERASAMRDELDHPEPPVIGEYVSVYFPHREWNALAKTYCIDARPEPTEGEVWDFEVKTNIRDKVNLTFEGIATAPSEFEVWLVDESLQITQNLRESPTYSVAGSEQPKALKLVAGKREFITQQLAEINLIPATYELSQNFPNPFNPVTTIRYGLPQAERVTLKIYNLLGEEVATLVNDEHKAPGYHAAIWDGRGKNGSITASGVYVYRMRAGSFAMTRKLLMVK